MATCCDPSGTQIMKTRLALFVVCLLVLPFAGLLLGGGEWDDLAASDKPAVSFAPLITTILALLVFTLLTNLLVIVRSGNNPFKLQRDYFLAIAGASVVLGWLLLYLDHYTGIWMADIAVDTRSAILLSLLFALLAPAVLSTRALLGSFAALLKRLSNLLTIQTLSGDTATLMLLTLALAGLIAGAAWPGMLFWLFWIAPLLLIVALQLMWHESTLFAGLERGDWGRLLCASVSGLIVGNLLKCLFELTGGNIIIHLPNLAFLQLGFALFGLLCLQLGDVVAEFWRGKSDPNSRKKKPFPIPVVVKK